MLGILTMVTLVLNEQFHFLVLDAHSTTEDGSTDNDRILILESTQLDNSQGEVIPLPELDY
jgi:hypothetical protein